MSNQLRRLAVARHFGCRPRQVWNLLRYRLARGRSTVVGYDPPSINLYVTDACNSACRFCPQHGPDRPASPCCFHTPERDLSFDAAVEFLSLFPGTLSVTFAGFGEPLLNPDLWRMVEWAAGRGCLCSVITNGKLLAGSRERLGRDRLRLLCVSVNAATPDAYVRLTGQTAADYAAILAGVREAAATRRQEAAHLNLYLSYILTRDTLPDVPACIAQAAELGADEVGFHNLLNTGIPGFGPDQVLTAADTQVPDLFARLQREYAGRIRVCPPKLKPATPAAIRCGDPFRVLNIDAAGNVGGCGRIMTPAADRGNLRRDGRAAWNSPHYQELRRMVIERRFAEHPICRDCMGD